MRIATGDFERDLCENNIVKQSKHGHVYISVKDEDYNSHLPIIRYCSGSKSIEICHANERCTLSKV